MGLFSQEYDRRLVEAFEKAANALEQLARAGSLEDKPEPQVKAAVTWGHGHVYPRVDGVKARCGGPAMCSECSRDAARKKLDEQ